MNTKRKIIFSISIALSIAFLYLSFSKIEISSLLLNLKKLSLVHIAIYILSLLIGYCIRAIRWKYILIEPGMKFSHLFSSSMIGHMGNNVFPMRMGEFMRCYVLGYQENISKSRILGSILFERVIDGLTVFLFFLISLFFTDVGKLFVNSAIILFMIFGLILLLLFASNRYREKSFLFLTFLLYFFPQNKKEIFKKKLRLFLSGLEIFQNKKYLIVSILYSFLFWGSGIIGTYFLISSSGNIIPFHLPIILISALVVGVMIPAAPGFIGTYHYVVILVLGHYDWKHEMAVGMSVVLHGIQFIIPIIIGLVLIFNLGYSFKELIQRDIKV